MLRPDDQKISNYDWPNRSKLQNSFYKVLHLKTGNFVAIKEYFLKDLNSDTLAFIKSQASAAEAVKGDYIIKHIKTFWFPEFIYMIWELCQINLAKYLSIRKLEIAQKEIGEFGAQIVRAMKLIQSKDCVFNNMNPYNIFRKDGMWKVGGFTRKDELKIKSVKEKIDKDKSKYFAPQVLLQNKIQTSNKAEVWSFGMILYQMAYGTIPFFNMEMQQFKKAVSSDSIFYPETNINLQLKNLIEKCLQRYQQKRFSWDDIQNHPFIAPYTKQKESPKLKKKQDKNLFEILTALQTSAVLQLGSAEGVRQFFEGNLQLNGIRMTSNKLLRFDEFRTLCRCLNPNIDEVEIKMLFKQIDTTEDGFINQSEFARLIFSLGFRNAVDSFLKQLADTIKAKNIDAQKLFQNYDYDSSGTLEQKQIIEIHKNIVPKFPMIELKLVIHYIHKQFNGRIPIDILYTDYKSRTKTQSSHKNSAVETQLKRFRSQLKLYEATINQIVHNFDRNKNQKLDFQEFKKMVFSIDKFVREDELRLMFKEVDKDGSGHVTVSELQKFYESTQ